MSKTTTPSDAPTDWGAVRESDAGDRIALCIDELAKYQRSRDVVATVVEKFGVSRGTAQSSLRMARAQLLEESKVGRDAHRAEAINRIMRLARISSEPRTKLQAEMLLSKITGTDQVLIAEEKKADAAASLAELLREGAARRTTGDPTYDKPE